ncbi:type II secretion system F family protein [Lacisediminihabitans sp. H27-G8]|uniref:type II secretion system F family protein n=1 Tax=Lacisediminihabitans sp. H27-G8 TaxID=3111909 RepID=UPI0038FC33EE
MLIYAALAGGLLVGGIVMMVVAFRPAPNRPDRHSSQFTLTQRWAAVTRQTKTTVLVGVLLGVLAAAVSGIIILVVVVPAAVIGLPVLLGKPDTRERDLLSALETWSRSLSSAAETGAFTLREVISITRGSAPPILRVAADRLNQRMSGSWHTSEALRQFAAEMNSAHVDEVIIYLIQAAEYNAGGLTKALDAVAEMLAEENKLQLDTAIEREKPRRSLITMTGIITVVLVGIILFSHTNQIALYRTPLGEVILAIILGVFVVLLVWARAQSRVKPEARIILPALPSARRRS